MSDVWPPEYRVIEGEYVSVTDGDTIRFVPRTRELLQWLPEPGKVKVARDGSVSLRLQGIDTPELHYSSKRSCFVSGRPEAPDFEQAQPFGKEAAEALGELVGVQERAGRVRGSVLTRGVDTYGRLIAYALRASDADGLTDGALCSVDQLLLARTLNCEMLDRGMAYYVGYQSMPIEHRRLFRGRALQARAKQDPLGIWAAGRESTARFRLRDEGSIDPYGSLIFPKLFRRSIDFLYAVSADDFRGNLKEWLEETDRCKSGATQDDRVLVGRPPERRLSELIKCDRDEVRFTENLFDLVFFDRRSGPAT